MTTPEEHRAPTDIEIEQLLVMLEHQIATWKGNPDYLRRLRVEHTVVLNADRIRRGMVTLRRMAIAGETDEGIGWCAAREAVYDYVTLVLEDSPGRLHRETFGKRRKSAK
jgi:hypothetical protein